MNRRKKGKIKWHVVQHVVLRALLAVAVGVLAALVDLHLLEGAVYDGLLRVLRPSGL